MVNMKILSNQHIITIWEWYLVKEFKENNKMAVLNRFYEYCD